MEKEKEELGQVQEERKGYIRYFEGGDGKVWTPEEKAELRKKFPEKLNGFGKWFFSTNEPAIIVNNPEAVYGEC